jgi:hypothetical protein
MSRPNAVLKAAHATGEVNSFATPRVSFTVGHVSVASNRRKVSGRETIAQAKTIRTTLQEYTTGYYEVST